MRRTIQYHLRELVDRIDKCTRLHVQSATYEEYVNVAMITLVLEGECAASVVGLYDYMANLRPQMTIKIAGSTVHVTMRVCAVNTSIQDMVNGNGNCLPLSHVRELQEDNVIMAPRPTMSLIQNCIGEKMTIVAGYYIYGTDSSPTITVTVD